MTPITVPAAGIGVWEGVRVTTPHNGVGIVTDVTPDTEHGITVSFGRGDIQPLGYLLRDLRLDLTHRPTRLAVMAWLAERAVHAPPKGCRDRGGLGALWWYSPGECAWRLEIWDHSRYRTFARDGIAVDPFDDSRLPDGARVVDVQALAIVATQVVGSPAPTSIEAPGSTDA